MIRYAMIVALAAPLMSAGCASDPIPTGSGGGGEAPRGGKADSEIYGSCADTACGDQSSDGTCWCDEDCTMYGDCCDDIASYCGSGPTCPATGIVCTTECPESGRLPSGAPCRHGEWNEASCSCDAPAPAECPATGIVCTPDCPASGRMPSGAPCNRGEWNESTCTCEAPSDCRETGCPAGDYCSFCWGTFQCIPEGALC